FAAKGTVADGVLTGTFKATIAGEGELRIERRREGLIIKLTGQASGNDVVCDGEALPQLSLTKEQLEAKLFELERELQYSRYVRPEPVRYRTPSRKTELRFTPTV